MARIMQTYPDLIRDKPDFVCNKIDMQEFATAQDMMCSRCLKVGYAHTLGYDEIGDGKSSYYRITPQESDESLKCLVYYADEIDT